MVKPRQPQSDLRTEFAGGLLPGLTAPSSVSSGHDGKTVRQQDGKPVSPPAGVAERQTRRKVTLYLDDPKHIDVIDELLSRLRKTTNLPRDQSMLVRALLDEAAQALTDPTKLQALAHACASTLPNR